MTALRLGTFSPSVLVRVATRTGALARRGLVVEESAVTSSPAQFRSLLGGDLDAALTSPDNVLAYRFVPSNPLGQTADVRIVLGVDRGLGLALFGRAGLSSPAGLRGGVVGVDVASSGFAFALYEILERAGLRAGHDYEVRELGSTPQRLEELLAGRCDATMLNAGSDLRAADAGLPRLARAVDVARPYLGTVLAVAGPPTPEVRLLADGLRETAAALRAGSCTDVAVAEATSMGLPAGLADRYVACLLDPDDGLVADTTLHLAGLETVIRLRRQHGSEPDGVGDVLAAALSPESGLVDDVRERATRRGLL